MIISRDVQFTLDFLCGIAIEIPTANIKLCKVRIGVVLSLAAPVTRILSVLEDDMIYEYMHNNS
jgi:hypothetical protein